MEDILYENSRSKRWGILFDLNGKKGIMEVEPSMSNFSQIVRRGLVAFTGHAEMNNVEPTPPNKTADNLAREETSGKEFLTEIFKNDKWSSYLWQVPSLFKLDFCYPASEKDILKKKAQQSKLICETIEKYNSIVYPYLLAHEIRSPHNLWIDHILDGISEQASILKMNPSSHLGHVILPDAKWDQKDKSQLYLLCLVRRKDLYSMRDLSADTLPLLHFLKTEITKQ